jgi:hypothetical protein
MCVGLGQEAPLGVCVQPRELILVDQVPTVLWGTMRHGNTFIVGLQVLVVILVDGVSHLVCYLSSGPFSPTVYMDKRRALLDLWIGGGTVVHVRSPQSVWLRGGANFRKYLIYINIFLLSKKLFLLPISITNIDILTYHKSN